MDYSQEFVDSYYANKSQNKNQKNPVKYITMEIVTRQAMTQDLKQILELDLSN